MPTGKECANSEKPQRRTFLKMQGAEVCTLGNTRYPIGFSVRKGQQKKNTREVNPGCFNYYWLKFF
jgi:hypothetical protein